MTQWPSCVQRQSRTNGFPPALPGAPRSAGGDNSGPTCSHPWCPSLSLDLSFSFPISSGDELGMISALIADPLDHQRNLHRNGNDDHLGHFLNLLNGEWRIHILQCSILLNIHHIWE